MIDSLLACQERAEASTILDDLGLRKEGSGGGSNRLIEPYALLTLHRPSNVDDGVAFTNILDGLLDLAAECPIIFPAHPRTRKRVKEMDLDHYFESGYVQRTTQGLPVAARRGSIRMVEPLGYLDFLCLMKHARVVVTDSGGIQEETTCLGVPCVTVRENTERPVTLERGTNVLAGVQKERIKDAVRRQLCRTFTNRIPENWDGRSATKIVELLVSEHKALQDLKENERDTLLA
jgi:UDP-N-acetylglucosamine 2-epimerase (non-hydrolysing)